MKTKITCKKCGHFGKAERGRSPLIQWLLVLMTIPTVGISLLVLLIYRIFTSPYKCSKCNSKKVEVK